MLEWRRAPNVHPWGGLGVWIGDKAPEEVKELLKDDNFRQGLEGLIKGKKTE